MVWVSMWLTVLKLNNTQSSGSFRSPKVDIEAYQEDSPFRDTFRRILRDSSPFPSGSSRSERNLWSPRALPDEGSAQAFR